MITYRNIFKANVIILPGLSPLHCDQLEAHPATQEAFVVCLRTLLPMARPVDPRGQQNATIADLSVLFNI